VYLQFTPDEAEESRGARDNHVAAIALHFMHYNFCRAHKTLRVTPAMEARIAGHVWSIEELVSIMPEPVAKTGTYKPRKK
jgi:hypothetical protein